ncbi:MAG: DUF4173 domain-containing protein, partial [Clostridiales bacterium]|jgi:hypothetical protein|nr:DUF4173 domain-containing protein [Clostridiales bacterium]
VAVWVYASGYPSRGGKIAARDWRLGNGWRADVVISATFLALLNLLFMLFAVVQCAYLFGGGFMTLPDGMVYSQYAREGFFQLLFVTLINFFVIIVFMCVLKGVRDSRLLRALLLALCLFTGVLIASSFYRMSLYIGVYGHTSMRLCVVTFLIMEVCLLCVTVTGLLRGNVPFIKCFLLIGLVFYMIVNVTGSDYFAARLNAGLLVSGRLRSLDLGHLGPDGLTAVKPLFESAGSSGSSEYICVLEKERKYVLVPRDSLSSSGAGFTFDEIAGIYRYPREKHWQNRTLLHVSNFQS